MRATAAPRSIRRLARWFPFVTLALAAVACPAWGQEPTWGRLKRGHDLFAREWRPNDSRARGGDGLGPVYNASSCLACHSQGAPGGAGPASTNVNLLNLAPFQELRVDGRSLDRDEVIERLHPGLRESSSIVLHHSGTDPRYAAWLGELSALKGPNFRTSSSADRPDFPDVAVIHALGQSRIATITRRNPTPLFGVGLLDAIPDEVIVAAAREAQGNSPAPRGRVHRLKDGHVGKFGWKAQVGSLQEFVLTACANELGLEAPGHHQAASPFAPGAKARSADITMSECDALTAYVADLPAPVFDDLGLIGSASTRKGRRLFESTGCTDCHRARLGDVDGLHSDLLLHDMGQGLSDSGQYYGVTDPGSSDSPSSNEWRTPPLWGLRDSGPYLHDGRAQTLREAIALHGGQGQGSAVRFAALSIEQRFQIELFLQSLAAPAVPEELARRREVIRRDWEDRRVDAEAEAATAERQRVEADVKARREAEAARAEQAARRIAGKLRLARDLERRGHFQGAIEFYRDVVRESPDSADGRAAAERIKAAAERLKALRAPALPPPVARGGLM
jgi:hypothetical protein